MQALSKGNISRPLLTLIRLWTNWGCSQEGALFDRGQLTKLLIFFYLIKLDAGLLGTLLTL